MTSEATKTILINTEEKHNKFWQCELTQTNGQCQVDCQWGRLGTKGQTLTKLFNNRWEAQSFIRDKINEKERKGYGSVTEDDLKLLNLRGELAGANAKVETMMFVKVVDNHIESVCYLDDIENPNYVPHIYCKISFAGNVEQHHLLFGPDKIYSSQNGPFADMEKRNKDRKPITPLNGGGTWEARYDYGNLVEINESTITNKALKKAIDRASKALGSVF